MRVPALLAILSALATAAPAQEPAPQVEAVRFKGVSASKERLVRDSIATRGPRCRSALLKPVCAVTHARWAERTSPLDTLALRADEERIRALYAAWGYPDARAAAELVPKGRGRVLVRFHVTEGEPIRVRTLRVAGMDSVPGALPLPHLPLRPGDIYSRPRVVAAQRRLATRLGELGYAFARVEPVETLSADGHQADVVLEVTPGPVSVFGTTTVQTDLPLRDRDVRSRLAYRPGDRFSPRPLERTAERLYSLPIVRQATLRPVPASTGDSVVDVQVVVVPTERGSYQIRGTLSSGTCLGGDAFVSTRYLWGAPRVLTVGGGGSNLGAKGLGGFCNTAAEGEFADPNYYVRAELQEPVGPDTWLLVRGAYQRWAEPRAYILRGAQGRVELSHLLAPGIRGSVAYAPQRGDNRASAPFFCAFEGICDLDDVSRGVTLAPLELAGTWAPLRARRFTLGPRAATPLDQPEVPNWLYSARAGIGGAAGVTGSEARYAVATAEGSATRLVGGRGEVAAHARLGILFGRSRGDRLPPQVRFFGGGPHGVRGLPQNLLGPLILILPEDRQDRVSCLIVTGGCQGERVDPSDLLVRATGGDALVETNLEGRLWVSNRIMLATFVDFGALRTGAPDEAPPSLHRTQAVVTPGVGVLALTFLGPVRVDLAYNPSPVRSYPLVTRDSVTDDFIFLGEVPYDPYGGNGGDQPLHRWQFQISLGLPF